MPAAGQANISCRALGFRPQPAPIPDYAVARALRPRLWLPPLAGTGLGGRLGFRVGLGYFERDRESGPSVFGTFSELYNVSTSRTVALNIDLTYDLTRSRIRPYVIGGLAPYWASVSQRYDSGRRVDYNHFGVALSPGLGLRFPLRHAEIFAEARMYLFSGHSDVFSPLTFGIRF